MKTVRTVLWVCCAAAVACDGPVAVEPPKESPAETSAASLVETSEGDIATAQNLRSLKQRHASHMVALRAPWVGSIEEGSHRDVQVVLSADRCFRVLGAGDNAIEDLDLLLYDSRGLLAQQDTGHDPQPVIGLAPALCPTSAGVYRLRVRAHRGSGQYTVQLFGG